MNRIVKEIAITFFVALPLASLYGAVADQSKKMAQKEVTSVFYKALLKKDFEAADLALANGAIPEEKKLGVFLHDTDDLKMVNYLLVKRLIFPDFQDERNWTALHGAAYSADVKRMKLLLWYGANPKLVNNQGDTPLHIASRSIFKSCWRNGELIDEEVNDKIDRAACVNLLLGKK